ncbi:hypothetical protein DRQ53_10160 [bacterium]|nr:MAG: hypothetical protein DRQ53_10160 [bacterium]
MRPGHYAYDVNAKDPFVVSVHELVGHDTARELGYEAWAPYVLRATEADPEGALHAVKERKLDWIAAKIDSGSTAAEAEKAFAEISADENMEEMAATHAQHLAYIVRHWMKPESHPSLEAAMKKDPTLFAKILDSLVKLAKRLGVALTTVQERAIRRLRRELRAGGAPETIQITPEGVAASKVFSELYAASGRARTARRAERAPAGPAADTPTEPRTSVKGRPARRRVGVVRSGDRWAVESEGETISVHPNRAVAERRAEVLGRGGEPEVLIDADLEAKIEAAGHTMQTRRKARKTIAPKGVKIAPKERAMLLAASKAYPGISLRDLTAYVRETKADHPASAGWLPMALKGFVDPAKLKKGEDGKPAVPTPAKVIQWVEVGYSYSYDPATGKGTARTRNQRVKRLAGRVTKAVRGVVDLAREGDNDALVMLRQRSWYSNVVSRLYDEFGSSAEILVDLLGALSPNTPVATNFKFATQALQSFMRGDFDVALDAWRDHREAGGSYLNYTGPVVRQVNMKLFGINTQHAMDAMLVGRWRIAEAGAAPKAKNFSWNLSGWSVDATIDVWAARFLQRVSGLRRVPPPVEKGVRGNWNDSNKPGQSAQFVTGEFGFAQEAMELAAAELGMDASDLQALVWFLEKQRWTSSGWTTKDGEGGSFEQQLDKLLSDRWIAGVSTEREPAPHTPARAGIISRTLDLLRGDGSVYAYRAPTTVGMFQWGRELSFDMELTAARDWDPTAWTSELRKIAVATSQDSFFVARAMRNDEDVSSAAPGLEVRFAQPIGTDEASRLVDLASDAGFAGAHLMRDPRLDRPGSEAERLGAPEQFIGMRVLWVKERTEGENRKDALVRLQGLRVTIGEDTLVQSAHARDFDLQVENNGKEYHGDPSGELEGAVGGPAEAGSEAPDGAGPGEADRSGQRAGRDRAGLVGVGDASSSSGPKFSVAPARKSPAFRRWFAGSKVVDADGKPLVVYHGTDQDFSVFDHSAESQFGYGEAGPPGALFFSTSPGDADYYAGEGRKGSNAMPAYLSAQNPKVLNRESQGFGLWSISEAVQQAKSEGHDGVLFEDVGEWVVFSPTQVKSATGNRGTFDAKNPDIRFSVTGFHGSPHEFEKFDTEKMGSGEGFQAFGWGVYIASRQGVAQHYKEMAGDLEATVTFPDGTTARADGDDGSVMFDKLARIAGEESAERIAWAFESELDWPRALAHLEDQAMDAEAEASDEDGDRYSNDDPDDSAGVLRDAATALGAMIKDGLKSSSGHGYEVLVKPDESEYLLWDKPLSEQSEHVQGAIASLPSDALVDLESKTTDELASIAASIDPDGTWYWDNYSEEFGVEDTPEGRAEWREGTLGYLSEPETLEYLNDRRAFGGSRTGDSIYRELSTRAGGASRDFRGGDKATSLSLLAAGIRGIKYLDGTSRGRGPGKTYNYVLFDAADIEITGRFSVIERAIVSEPIAPYKESKGALGYLRRVFHGKMPKIGVTLDDQRRGFIQDHDARSRQLMRKFNRVIRKEYGSYAKFEAHADYARYNNALEGKFEPELPPFVKESALNWRDHIDTLSQMLIDWGVVEGELAATVKKNKGMYLHRSYQRFDIPEQWAKNLERDRPEVLNKFKALVRSAHKDWTEEAVAGYVQRILKGDSSAAFSMLGYDPTFPAQVGPRDTSVLRQRRPLTDLYRSLLGEYTDPRVKYLRSVSKIATLLAGHKFIENFREEARGVHFFDAPTSNENGDFVHEIDADASQILYPLGSQGEDEHGNPRENAMFTTKEIAEAFEEMHQPSSLNAAFRGYMVINSAVKIGKTVWSPATQIRNLGSNVILAFANWHWRLHQAWPAMRAAYADIFKGGSNSEAVNEFIREGYEYGLMDQSVAAGELRDTLADVHKRGGPTEWLESSASKITKLPFRLLLKLYRSSDDVFKMYGWLNEIAKYRKARPDWSEQKLKRYAADIVRNAGYPTYDKIPEAIKKWRRFPAMASFISFQSEIVRQRINNAILIKNELADPRTRGIGSQRLAMQVGGMMGGAVLAYMSRMMFGMTDDDDKNARFFVAPWSQGNQFVWLPTDENGKLRFIDISYMDPFDFVTGPLFEFFRKPPLEALRSAGARLAEPFVSEEMMFAALMDVKRGRTARGSQIWREGDSNWEVTKQSAEHLWKELRPGIFRSVERIQKARDGYVEYWGRTYDLETEIVANTLGQRIETIEVEEQLKWLGGTYKRTISNASGIINEVMRDPNPVTREDLAKAFGRAMRNRDAGFADVMGAVRGARALQTPDAVISKGLNRAVLGKERVARLLEGEELPWEFSAGKSLDTMAKEGKITWKQNARRLEWLQELLDEKYRGPR